MTQRDRWQERKPVKKYRDWCDAAREAAGLRKLQKMDASAFYGVIVFAHFRIPKSYTKKRRVEIAGKMHCKKPDADNVIKAICDALFENDERIAMMQCYKYWAYDDEDSRLDVFLLPKGDTYQK